MTNALGLDRRDGRNALVLIAIMTLVVAFVAEGTVPVRLIAGFVVATVSGVVFLLATVLINRYKPDHW